MRTDLHEWACEGCDPATIDLPEGRVLYAMDDEDDEHHGTGGDLVVCPYSVKADALKFCTRFLAARKP